MKRLSLASALLASVLFVSPAAHAQELVSYEKLPAGTYKIDPTHASLTWKVLHMGMSNYTARFKKVDADITFDPADVTKSKVVATIDPKSIETDYPNKEPDFNKELAEGDKWFNAAKFPSIKFESTKIEKTGGTTGKIHGNLTFMGVTKPVTLNAEFVGGYEKMPMMNVPAMGFSASTTIKRSEWGMSNYIPMIGDDVKIQIEAEFRQEAAKVETAPTSSKS